MVRELSLDQVLDGLMPEPVAGLGQGSILQVGPIQDRTDLDQLLIGKWYELGHGRLKLLSK